MSPPRSFKNRLLRSFFLFGAALLFILVAFLFMTYQTGREDVTQALFLAEIEAWRARRAADPSTPLPDGWIRGYAAPADIPEPWRSNLDRFAPEDDPNLPLREWREVQLWTGPVPGADGDVYLFADHAFAPGSWLLNPNLLRLVGAAALLTLGFGYWMSRLVSRRLAHPLEQLQARIEAYQPGGKTPLAAGDYPDRELARLAASFRDLHERIDAFVAREQEFTRHASHELRTPITVIRAAGSVLQQHMDGFDERARRAVMNLIRSADDMTRLVNTFLWMAREDGEVERDPVFEAERLLTALVNHHRVLLSPGRTLALRVDRATWTDFPGNLFAIAAANLIRNAVQHAGPGTIDVILFADRLEVRNPRAAASPGPTGASSGGAAPEHAGLGLRIIDRIANRCGWTWTSQPSSTAPDHWLAVLHLTTTPA